METIEQLRKRKREEKAKRRTAFLAAGVCTKCGKTATGTKRGQRYCARCKRDGKKRYRHFRSKGLCGGCGKAPPTTGTALCWACKTKNKIRVSKMYRKRLDAGLCTECGRAPHRPMLTRCPECSARHAAKSSGHGIQLAERAKLLAEQGGRCPVCSREIDLTGSNVDHDHDTGRIRGLICGRCNVAMGWFQDDPELLEAAALYLRRDEPMPLGICG